MRPSASCPRGSGDTRQAVIRLLWTSNPAQCVKTTSMTHLTSDRLAGYPCGESLHCVLGFFEEAGDRFWCLQISGSNSNTGSRHQAKNDLAPSLLGAILSCFGAAGQRKAIFMCLGVPGDMTTHRKIATEPYQQRR